MLQGWAMEKELEGRRRDLAAMAEHRRVKVTADALETAANMSEWSQLSVTGVPLTTAPARRPMAERLGSWLIQTGTRLGGASMSPMGSGMTPTGSSMSPMG
jgi:hypothetical protein